MTDVSQPPALPPPVSDNGFALGVYVLYLIGFLTGFTALIGVIVAHVKVNEADAMSRSHFQFQIRTFWFGLIYLAVGGALSIVLIGIPILIWWMIWTLVRIIKGMILLNENRPIPQPQSWLFG